MVGGHEVYHTLDCQTPLLRARIDLHVHKFLPFVYRHLHLRFMDARRQQRRCQGP